MALAAVVVGVFGGAGAGSCCVYVGRRVSSSAPNRKLAFAEYVDRHGSWRTDLGVVADGGGRYFAATG